MKFPQIYGKDDEFDEEDDSINMKLETEKTINGQENTMLSEENYSALVSVDSSDANSTSS